MGLSSSSSSDCASDHGQRAGTQSDGFGAAAATSDAKLNNAAQRIASIRIYYYYLRWHGL
jgi:hypothetical protein